jgi:hypothetical protein
MFYPILVGFRGVWRFRGSIKGGGSPGRSFSGKRVGGAHFFYPGRKKTLRIRAILCTSRIQKAQKSL